MSAAEAVTALTLLRRKRKLNQVEVTENNGCNKQNSELAPSFPSLSFLLPSKEACSAAHEYANNPCIHSSSRGVRAPLRVSLGLGALEDVNQHWQWLRLPVGVSELSGAAGAGKTQICLSLCISCVLSDLRAHRSISESRSRSHYRQEQKHEEHKTENEEPEEALEALYVSMGEGTSSAKLAHRLNQMLSIRLSQTHHPINSHTPVTVSPQRLTHMHTIGKEKAQEEDERLMYLKRIQTRQICTQEEFQQFLMVDLEPMLQHHSHLRSRLPLEESHSHSQSHSRKRIGLIILDSLAGLFRIPDEGLGEGSYSSNNTSSRHKHEEASKNYYIQRSATFYTIAAQLKRLSERYGVCFVVVNQVTCSLNLGQDSSTIIPSLGLSWSNCVSERYFVHRREGAREGEALASHKHAHAQDSDAGSTGTPRKFTRGIKLLTSATWGTHEAKFRIEPMGVILCKE